MSYALTPAQARLLGYLKAKIAEDGIAPTYDEMTAQLAIPRGRIHRILVALEQRGHIKRLKYHRRAIEITETSDPLDAARHALVRVGAPATSSNLTRVAGALQECLAGAPA